MSTAQADAPRLCVIIFEGRTGSSELISRLNSHPDAFFYPEILHLAGNPERDFAARWNAIDAVFQEIAAGRPILTDTISFYHRPGVDLARLKVVGLKTRLNEASDGSFFNLNERGQNFYVVEGARLMETLVRHDALLIRLRRRDVLRSAISWHRSLALSGRSGLWNLPASAESLGPIRIDAEALIRTMDWVESCREKHDRAYDAYAGDKMAIDYEDMLGRWPETERRLLAFLDLAQQSLVPFFEKVTPDDLTAAVTNLAEVKAAVAMRAGRSRRGA